MTTTVWGSHSHILLVGGCRDTSVSSAQQLSRVRYELFPNSSKTELNPSATLIVPLGEQI